MSKILDKIVEAFKWPLAVYMPSVFLELSL